MKKPGSDKNAGKKKAAPSKNLKVDDKKIEKYKKQSLNPEDEDDEFDVPMDDNAAYDDFDDFDDDFDDDDDY